MESAQRPLRRPRGPASLKLLMLAPYFHPETNAAAARANAFAKYFQREGAEVTVMVPKTDRIPPTANLSGLAISRVENYDSIRETRGIIRSAVAFPKAVRGLRAQIESAAPDIVMTTTPSPFFAYEGHLACKRLRIPIVFDVRDTWLLLSLNHPGRMTNYLKRRIEGQCCWGARKTLVVTSMLGDQLIEDHSLPRERIMLAPNGADLEMFSVRSSPEVDAVFLGAPSTYRNLEGLFRAISLLMRKRPSTTVRYIGWVDNDHTRQMMSVARSLDLEGRVEFLPPVPHSDVPLALSKAKVGIVSVTGEHAMKPAVGAKTYEYLAAGLPLACLGPPVDCELRRLWKSTQAGFYESEPDRFAVRLGEVLDDDGIRNAMAAKARSAAVIFDRKVIANRVYHEVLMPLVEDAI